MSPPPELGQLHESRKGYVRKAYDGRRLDGHDRPEVQELASATEPRTAQFWTIYLNSYL